VIFLVKREVDFAFWKSVFAACVGAILQALWYAGILRVVPHSAVGLMIAGTTGGILYLGVVLTLEKKRITDTVRSFRS